MSPNDESRPPPVGLNWGVVAQRLGIDLRVLERTGSIVLAGETFPEAGYAIDPATVEARFVDVGEIALRHCYFLGELALSNARVHVPVRQDQRRVAHPVIPRARHGPLIALFADATQAQRAKQRILDGSLASGIRVQLSSLGTEVRVERPQLGGRAASVLASHGGAIISIGGRPVAPVDAGAGPPATGPSILGEQADALRPGTGVASDMQRPANELGSSEERPNEGSGSDARS